MCFRGWSSASSRCALPFGLPTCRQVRCSLPPRRKATSVFGMPCVGGQDPFPTDTAFLRFVSHTSLQTGFPFWTNRKYYLFRFFRRMPAILQAKMIIFIPSEKFADWCFHFLPQSSFSPKFYAFGDLLHDRQHRFYIFGTNTCVVNQRLNAVHIFRFTEQNMKCVMPSSYSEFSWEIRHVFWFGPSYRKVLPLLRV